MPATEHQSYSAARDPVFISALGFLAGLGTVIAVVAHFRAAVVLVYLLVAVLVLIWTAYLRARPPVE